MNAVCVADTHFEQERDLDVLSEIFQIAAKRKAKLIFLGDVFHSARPAVDLFNLFADRIAHWTGPMSGQATILLGNHDISGSSSLLSILRHAKVEIISAPVRYDSFDGTDEITYLYLPWTPSIKPEVYSALVRGESAKPKHTFVLGHMLLEGAVVNQETRLAGVSLPKFTNLRGGLFGDVHAPISVGSYVYIGSARSVTFAEDHRPRVALLNGFSVEYATLKTASRSFTFNVETAKDYAALIDKIGDKKDLRRHRIRLRLGPAAEYLEETARKFFEGFRDFSVITPETDGVEEARERAVFQLQSVADFVKANPIPKDLRKLYIRMGESFLSEREN